MLPAASLAGLGLLASACSGTISPPATADTLHKAATPVTDPPPPPVYPLTGLPVTDPAKAARPALSVKIDNVSGSFPQVGIGKADMVAEALVEGGLTRLFATFQSQDAAMVGPIRSARPVDAALLRELGGGIFAYSGAAAGEIAPAKAKSTATLLSNDAGIPAFHRVSWRSGPHNVFASTTDLYAAGRSAGARWSPPPQLFDYSSTPQGGTAAPAGSAYMDMSTYSSSAWTWSPTAGVWLRSQDGSPDMNSDGSRMSAHNVVILSVAIAPSGIFDAAGNQDPWVVLVGSGPAWVLRDGQLVAGTWQRQYITDKVALTGTLGTITLEPGTTWLELLPRPNLPKFKP